MEPLAKILSIQVGKVEHFPASKSSYLSQKEWTSAINKKRVDYAIELRKIGLLGDEQADPKSHGGYDKAVCVYPSEHFAYWQSTLSLELTAGGFGENLTTQHLSELDVCIGDVYQIGTCRLEVSQPRQPCWKLAKLYDIKELALRVQQTGRSGWYLRVVEEGELEAGSALKLLHRPSPAWTIEAANQLMHHDKANYLSIEKLLHACPALSTSWKQTFQSRLTKQSIECTEDRIQQL